jgi:4-amino-4-deoxy-L-arabinose transferase-like glycosyltransferase
MAVAALWLASPIINEDGVQYLDMADAWRRGDWSTALSTYWSPLYSWALAGVLAVGQPSPPHELFAVRAFNVATFGGVLLVWLTLLGDLAGEERPDRTPLLQWCWWMSAALLGAWLLLRTIGIESATPDLMATGLLLLAAIILVRQRDGGVRASDGVALGLVVGAAVLARSALVTLVPLAAVLVSVRAARATRGRVMLGFLLGVTCTFGVFVVALSHDQQRWTMGDTGRLNYAWFVNGVTRYVHWQGDEPGSGTAAHPTRVARQPDLFVFDEPSPCTFAPACDPGYWHEGLRLHFGLAEQWAASQWVLDQWRWLVFERLAFVPLLVLVLALVVDTRALGGPGARICFVLAGAAAVSYLGVYSEARHVTGALLLVLAPALAVLRRPGSIGRWGLLVLLCVLCAVSLRMFQSGWQRTRHQGPATHPQWAIAETLAGQGVTAGSKVARIGEAPGTYWARLGGLHIVAAIPDADQFWQASPDTRADRLTRLEAAGARAVVADGRGMVTPPGWTRVAGAQWVIVRAAGRQGP